MNEMQLPLHDSILLAWSTTNRVTVFLVEHLPDELWGAAVPSCPRRTIRSIAAHLHNARCGGIKTLGRPHGIVVPRAVDRHRVTRTQMIGALKGSSDRMTSLLTLGLKRDGRIPPTAAYVWRNLPLDVGHVLTYFVAHEAHHRGQIVLVARAARSSAPTGCSGWSVGVDQASRGGGGVAVPCGGGSPYVWRDRECFRSWMAARKNHGHDLVLGVRLALAGFQTTGGPRGQTE